MSKKTFGNEEKNKMIEALNILENVIDDHMQYGQSWWALPNMNGFKSCDMGYVWDFFAQLRRVLSDETYGVQPFDSLRNPPDFSDYD